MDANPRLYVEIHPFEGSHAPHPHPVRDGRFDPAFVYKVLGMYNPSETSECYFMLSNPQRQIWFIPQRHLLAYKLIDSDEFFLPHPAPPAAKPMPARMTAGVDGEGRPRPGDGTEGRRPEYNRRGGTRMDAAITFDQVLDAVELLPAEQQADLVDVVRRRLALRGRERVIETVRASREEHAAGRSRVATVEEIMREIGS